jgi:hypothetical protein
MLSCAVPKHSEASDGVSYSWAGSQLFGDSYIGSFGRVFDLIVLGRPGQNHEPPRMTTVEVALFESGRPVLLVPPSSPGSIGETIVVAWNGSTETARTVAPGLPILSIAKRVFILTVEGWEVDGPTGEELATRLQRNEIPADSVVRRMRRSQHRDTRSILTCCASCR